MTKFEEIGVELQINAYSVKSALKNFKYSCRVCNNHGMRINCDNCAIAQAHKSIMLDFQLMDEMASCPSK